MKFISEAGIWPLSWIKAPSAHSICTELLGNIAQKARPVAYTCIHFFLSALSINSNTSISTKLPVTDSFLEIVTTSNVTKLFCFHLGWHSLIWSQAALLHEVCGWVFVNTVIMTSTEAENLFNLLNSRWVLRKSCTMETGKICWAVNILYIEFSNRTLTYFHR